MNQLPLRTTGRPTAKKSETIEQTLLAAAFEEFVEYGYARASLTRVVERARMSKTTLYSRYPSKAALFSEVVRSRIDQSRPQRALNPASRPMDIAEGLERFAIDMLKVSFEPEMHALNRVILGEFHQFPDLIDASDEKMQQGIQRISHFLEDNSRSQNCPIENPGEVAKAFIHMIRGWYLYRLMANETTSEAQIREWVRIAIRSFIRPGPKW